MALGRIRVALTGFPGGPGVSTFYSSDAPATIAAIRTYWNALSGIIPVDVHIQVENTGDIIDPLTGALTGAWVGAAQAPVVGGSAEVYGAPVGALARWATNTILDGHRVRGRTFIVPVTSNFFTTSGALGPVASQTVTDASAALVVNSNATLTVWHRPFKGSAATLTRPARPAHPGGVAVVTGSSASPKAVVLRSRRD